MYKQLSGAQKRKLKTKQDAVVNSLKGSMNKYLKLNNNDINVAAEASEAKPIADAGIEKLCNSDAKTVKNSDLGESEPKICSNDLVDIVSNQLDSLHQLEEVSLSDEGTCKTNIYPSDVGLWPNEIPNDLREYFTFVQPQQFINEIVSSKCVIGQRERSLNESNFYRRKKNNELVKRDWLVYSPSKKSVFCYICKLFSNSNQALCKDGFAYWKNVNERLQEHENSVVHRNSVLCLSQRRTSLSRIDSQMVEQVKSEQEYWRKVLFRVVASIKFLAARGLAFYGEDETMCSAHNGNFLGVLELISQFDPFIAEHLSTYANPGKGNANYLSSTTVAELLDIMGHKVKNVIINEVKKAKYFGLILDSTPDITHNDQLSVVLRYVNDCGEPVERFLTFIHIHSHESDYLTKTVLSLLNECGIDINNCRGQSYDNASNMSGKYAGVQARIKALSPLSEYIPCSAHSLNLVGVASVECCAEVVSYFGLVQSVYSYFAASSQRWDKLLSKLITKSKLTLKRLSDTRWSAAADATRCLRHNYVDIMDTLHEIANNDCENPSARHEAKCLYKKLEKFENAILTVVWDTLLQRINKVNKTLQSKSGDLTIVVPLYDSLISFVQSIRDDFSTYETEAATFVEGTYNVKRNIKVPKHYISESDEVMLNPRDSFITKCHYVMCDKLMTELHSRRKAYLKVQNNFGFLMKNFSSVTEIKNEASDFLEMYNCDIEDDFAEELYQFLSFLPKDELVSPEEKLKIMRSQCIVHTFPNVDTALQILLTMPITNCSSERSFSVLKRIKNRLRSSTKQQKLSALAIMSIESDITSKMDFQDVIDAFAMMKTRKKAM